LHQCSLKARFLGAQHQNTSPCKQCIKQFWKRTTTAFLSSAIEVPAALAHLIAVNVEYELVLCVHAGCLRAVSQAASVEHLRCKTEMAISVLRAGLASDRGFVKQRPNPRIRQPERQYSDILYNKVYINKKVKFNV
jgi:hypothetical protein